ncbi:hypothetical protein ACFWIX_14750 [Pseudarthrobacter sp. NPDC058362]|uniref:hypothetical protein n=1 Tax=Pseudarthrobacter sp. NPDC058362 TaxID=3346458 RepID=UPI00364F5C0A
MRGQAARTPYPATAPALFAAAALFLSGCTGPGGGGSGWTAAPEAPPASEAAGEDPGATATSSPSATSPGTADPSAGPQPAATASAWKTYSAPDKSVSFELPEEWIVQSVSTAKGTLAGALALEVKKPDGTFMAALRTGLPPSSATCSEAAKREYTVLSSVPAGNLAAGTVAGTIPPRVVFRVIKGYRYFGSYGITNVVAGTDGRACELRNTVRGPAAKGDYSFGDVPVLRAFAADEKVAPAKAFNTLAEAGEYAAESEDFANVQRMLMSLEIED